MSTFDFTLVTERKAGIAELPEPAAYNIPVNGLTVAAKRGKAVERGGVIATCPSKECADAHAPVAGKIMKLSFAYVTVKPSDEDSAVEPVDIDSAADHKELVRTLRSLGVDTKDYHEAELLVVNGLNPEPGVTVAEALLSEERATLEKGLSLALRLVGPSRCVLASSGQAGTTEFADCDVQTLKPVYPGSVDELVVKGVTGKENPGNVVVVSVSELWALGRVASTGMPLDETVATVNGVNYRIKIGTPLGHVFEHAGLEAGDGSVVRIGGPIRGVAAYSLDQGVPAGCIAADVVPAGEFAPVENVACINCGECVLACPARLMPNLITRHAEFDMFDKCRDYGIDSCLDCGMCAVKCMARRPLLHLIRFAKEQLRMQKDA